MAPSPSYSGEKEWIFCAASVAWQCLHQPRDLLFGVIKMRAGPQAVFAERNLDLVLFPQRYDYLLVIVPRAREADDPAPLPFISWRDNVITLSLQLLD